MKATNIILRVTFQTFICFILVIFSSGPVFWLIKHVNQPLDREVFLLILALNSFLFMFLIPISLRIVKGDHSDFSLLKLPDPKLLTAFVPTFVINLIVIFLVSLTSPFDKYYSTSSLDIGEHTIILLISGLVYYFSEEFLFRGYLLNRTAVYLGGWSIWLNASIFALLHIQKPILEILFSFWLALGLCKITQKTGSIWPAVFIHFVLAMTLNLLIFFNY